MTILISTFVNIHLLEKSEKAIDFLPKLLNTGFANAK